MCCFFFGCTLYSCPVACGNNQITHRHEKKKTMRKIRIVNKNKHWIHCLEVKLSSTVCDVWSLGFTTIGFKAPCITHFHVSTPRRVKPHDRELQDLHKERQSMLPFAYSHEKNNNIHSFIHSCSMLAFPQLSQQSSLRHPSALLCWRYVFSQIRWHQTRNQTTY